MGTWLLLIGVVIAVIVAQRQPVIAIVMVVLFSVPFVATIARVVRLRNKLGKARLFVPHESLPLGYEGVATYVRALRGGAAVRSIDVRVQCEGQLIQEKTNADGDGIVKSTTKAIVIDEPVAAVLIPMADELRVEIPLRIPEGGPSSLLEERNSIHWYVRLNLTMDRCPDTQSSFLLPVLPAVVRP
jgi:hypothetical protein